MRKTREEKAITLIALIITIVVLLILAVVAINAVTGDGIIQHAVNAKTEYEKAQTEEEMMLSNYETFLKGNLDIWDGESKKAPKIKDSDWYIYTCSEFKFFADFVNGELTDKEKEGLEITENTTVYLMSNLDFGARQTNGVWSGPEWKPIGGGKDNDGNRQSFIGTFEGNNHYVTGIYVNVEGDRAGLFGDSNTIQNLTIKDSYIEASGIGAGGIVCVLRKGSLINCHNINTEVIAGAGTVGGIVGQMKDATTYSINNCTNTGTIIGNADNVGGIVGWCAKVTIEKCQNSGKVNGLGKSIGGIVGQGGSVSTSASLVNCLNKGEITGEYYCVGGIAGLYSGTIEKCYNTGNITGTKENLGGICGGIMDEGEGYIQNCYNIGKVIGKVAFSKVIGGIVGKLSESASGTISNNYNIGQIEIKGENVYSIGGVIGDNSNTFTISNNYYLEGISTAELNSIGEEKTQANMKTTEFVGLLNTGLEKAVWELRGGANSGYPVIKGLE